MRTLAIILGLASGFALTGYYEPPARMIATSLIIDASLAPLTAVIASRRGRSPALWTVFGFSLGMWALAFVLIFRPHPAGSDQPVQPPTSDAA
jgi:hypothetical protein